MRKIYNSKEEYLASRRLKYKPTKDYTQSKMEFIEIVTESGCWIFMGQIDLLGYGYVRIKRKRQAAHRYFYEYYNGAIPKGLLVLHKCDVRCCVNPNHLWLGTQSDNMYDMYRKGRRSNSGNKNPNSKLHPNKFKEEFK